MLGSGNLLTATPLAGRRLMLEPLRIEHAEEMAGVLGDPELYRFTGGQPPSHGELRRRYAIQTAERSPDGSECWLNWIVRRHDGATVVGYVQASVCVDPPCAEVAWVIGTTEQNRGFATEAAEAMVGWLRRCGVSTFVAHIRPDNEASASVARHLGLRRTDRVERGERRWES